MNFQIHAHIYQKHGSLLLNRIDGWQLRWLLTQYYFIPTMHKRKRPWLYLSWHGVWFELELFFLFLLRIKASSSSIMALSIKAFVPSIIPITIDLHQSSGLLQKVKYKEIDHFFFLWNFHMVFEVLQHFDKINSYILSKFWSQGPIRFFWMS